MVKASPILPAITLEDQVNNVKRGWTADGARASHAPSTRPESARDYHRVTHIAGMLLRDLDGKLQLDDQARTLIIGKCIHHLSLPAEPEKLIWLYAGFYLARHPDALFRPLTLHDYANLWDVEAEALEREEQRQSFAMLEDRRAEMAAPPCPVLWSDGTREFVKLTHPFHVFESGHRSLDMLLYPRGEEEHASTPDEIRRLPYWLMIRKGCCLIYSLRGGGDFNHAATIIHTPVRTLMHTQDDDVGPILLEIAAWMRVRYGPRHFMATEKFRDRFLIDQTREACLPWGPEHEPFTYNTTSGLKDGWRVRGRHPLVGV